MRIERIGGLGDACTVLLAVADAADRFGFGSAAALIGDWFGSRAVIAPLRAAPVSAREVFATRAGASHGAAIGGGWIGYLSYPELSHPDLTHRHARAPRIPHAAGGWADFVLRQDRDGTWWYECLSGEAMPSWLAGALSRRPDRPKCRIEWAGADRDTHRAGVLACLDAIAAGEVYQACVCTQFTGELVGDELRDECARDGWVARAAVDFFADTVGRTAPARAAFVAGAWGAVASLSPELFLSRRGVTVTSSPIKGTAPRSVPPAELLASAKDVAENIMIVDLVRNDLGRVATVGSVTTPELLAVRPAPGVWHLVSTVSAQVAADVPMASLLNATFPPASVTGTPKTRARQLLSRWEPVSRGIFCGTIGLASPIAGTELNVAIRTVEIDARGSAVLGVGGGITADSDADNEWDECMHKAAPIIGVGQRAGSVASVAPFAAFARSTAS
ncbi:MAG: aminodeoxychorismate synthase component I [Mycobacteriaceae bacterium]|nr:aminodeoxychorismate synthase component I [Mycobacteriaceae bacterium]